MDGINEISKCLRFNTKNKMYKLKHMPCTTFAFDLGDQIGVAIPYYNGTEIFEQFNNIVLKTMQIELSEQMYLALLKPKNGYIDEFSHICYDFSKGDSVERNKLLNNPLEWVLKWKELLGNKNINNRCYDLFAELLIYKYKLDRDVSTVWYGSKYGTHDIETKTVNCEVKSTCRKYGTTITINSQYQLKKNANPVFIYFVRLEKSNDGLSINELISLFDDKTIDMIDENFVEFGYNRNSHIFKEKYKVLEIKEYEVNEKFPILKIEALNDQFFKDHLLKIEYSLSLDGLIYNSINYSDIIQ